MIVDYLSLSLWRTLLPSIDLDFSEKFCLSKITQQGRWIECEALLLGEMARVEEAIPISIFPQDRL